MFPIPRHIRDIFYPSGNDNTEYEVSGAVRCSCGCDIFRVRIFAEFENGYPCLAEYGDGYGLVIKTTCTNCLQDYTLFDDSQHGWNGVVVKDGIPVPERELKPWYCPDCEDSCFQIVLTIQSNGSENFINELEIGKGNSEFSAADWIDAFDWITIGLSCTQCRWNDEEWLDHECA